MTDYRATDYSATATERLSAERLPTEQSTGREEKLCPSHRDSDRTDLKEEIDAGVRCEPGSLGLHTIDINQDKEGK